MTAAEEEEYALRSERTQRAGWPRLTRSAGFAGQRRLAGLKAQLYFWASAIVRSSACWVPCHEFVVSNDSESACASRPRPPPPIVIAGMPMLIGMLESVDPSPRFALKPSTAAVSRPERRIRGF